MRVEFFQGFIKHNRSECVLNIMLKKIVEHSIRQGFKQTQNILPPIEVGIMYRKRDRAKQKAEKR